MLLVRVVGTAPRATGAKVMLCFIPALVPGWLAIRRLKLIPGPVGRGGGRGFNGSCMLGPTAALLLLGGGYRRECVLLLGSDHLSTFAILKNRMSKRTGGWWGVHW